MKILVANLGSTSFKYRLFDLSDERQIARGGIDRIGEAESSCSVEIGDYSDSVKRSVPDHGTAVEICLQQLTDPDHGCLASVEEVGGIGFKAVFAGRLSGVRHVTEELLEKMEAFAAIAPAHNPPYVRAMRQLQERFPDMPLVAALETGFHETVPFEQRAYAVPLKWYEDYEIRRWGFHGASHRYIATRMAELTGRHDLRLVSCHLGGSASVCAVEAGESRAASMGMSPQGGLPNNNRVGTFDPYAIPLIMKQTGMTFEEVLVEMSSAGGLLGISGFSGDVRDLEEAAAEGHERAELALRLFESSVRQHVGSYLAVLGGADAVVFTGGIGENSRRIRQRVCRNMEWAGLKWTDDCDQDVDGECRLTADDSSIAVWVVPTNEELVVARQTSELLNQASA